ncbi:MAG: hypothetical protein CME59_12080 [Halioglobus sp.]|mgnify:CR=1 FL=1|nr:hypothetical protein [Halioglobus sp.]
MNDSASQVAPAKIPLCVDLDGTLVHSDTLVESILMLVKRNPLNLIALLYWLLNDRARFKEKVAARVRPDVDALPYNQVFVDWLRGQRQEGRELVLVTAANYRIAQDVAQHLQLFDEVIASSASHNLKAADKRDELLQRYGAGGYDYAGNSEADLPVWSTCRRTILVNTPARVADRARAGGEIERNFPGHGNPVKALLRAMRPHQWVKNLLLFVNIILAHQYFNATLLGETVLAFVAFCICSSSVYLTNDLMDLQVDRRNSEKKHRPFASGQASLQAGIIAIPLLLLLAFTLAACVSPLFFAVLLSYFATTLAYSFYLKKHVLFDVLTLAGLYTIRIIAGASVAQQFPSVWLISFSMFVFTSLAMAKRYAELRMLEAESGSWIGGRGYHVNDLAVISQLGAASGYLSTLVLALYIDSPEVAELYSYPLALWLLCPMLMYWIGRIWLVANRGELRQDPVIYATQDLVSYIAVFAGGAILWLAR